MKITLDSLVLNPNGKIPKNFSIETQRQIQTEYALSSRLARVFDRGNTKILAQFEIERSHSSDSDAQMFALKHPAEISEHSDGKIDFTVPDGTLSKKTLRLKSAFPSKVKTQIDGLVTNTRYEFVATSMEEI